jgi:exodeoxyribonuclease-3
VKAPHLRVMSWNVNGLRACARKGFGAWLARCGAEVVGVQEVRAGPDALPRGLVRPRRWHVHFSSGERPGYSGVGLYARRPPDAVGTGLGVLRFDVEGRFQLARFGRLVVVNVYFPKGGDRVDPRRRLAYKLAFSRAVLARCQHLRRGGRRVLVLGDFNVAHREVDLARPRANRGTSGFLPEERADFGRWLAAGWIDTFRAFEPGPGHYTWWSQLRGVRERNIGWRIDYVLASPGAMPFVRRALIRPRVRGSDHCPVGVDLDPGVLA